MPPTLRVAFFFTLLATRPAALAQSTSQSQLEDPRKIARNPFADVISLPFEETLGFSTGQANRTANDLQFEPVLPLNLNDKWLLVTRVLGTVLAYQPQLTEPGGGAIGLGDTTASFFLTPAQTKRLIWGVGPALLIPSATNEELGAGKWALGPTCVVLTQPDWGSAGVLVANIWSFAGSRPAPVNQFQLELLFSRNLPRGWYLTSAPTIVADWTQPSADRWLVPIGAGPGRTINIGKNAFDWNIAGYWDGVRPSDQSAPRWQVSLQATIFVRKR